MKQAFLDNATDLGADTRRTERFQTAGKVGADGNLLRMYRNHPDFGHGGLLACRRTALLSGFVFTLAAGRQSQCRCRSDCRYAQHLVRDMKSHYFSYLKYDDNEYLLLKTRCKPIV